MTNVTLDKTVATMLTKLIAAILLLAASSSSAPQDQQQVRRFLLSAGANNGGRDKVVLRYAVSDANAFANVLIDMGGVDKNNALVLSDPSRRELLGGIDNLGRLIGGGNDSGANVRNEVFVYYSGHADEEGLKLAGETLGWAEFRSAVNGLNADVRVAVLDACGSGAITRTKGGVARPAFLSDASMNMTGYAFLTSSNENEASQESDRIRGSYFTHALLSGMRGAADMTGDGKVTINEVYQYAFNETLQNTQNTRAGIQHPSRDMNLAGTGDIVMTDLRQTSATLSLDPNIEGRFFIRDENGNLFAELRKMRGRPIELGLPAGKYTVQMEAPSRMWMAGDVVIADGGTTALTMNDMRPMERRRRTVARGSAYGVDYYDDNENAADNGIDDCEDDGDCVDDEVGGIADDDGATASARSSPPQSSTLTPQDTSAAASSTQTLTEASTPAKTALDSACAAPYRLNVNFVAMNDKPESGTQLSMFNMAGAEFCGAQIGLINALNSNGRGLQAGVINKSGQHFDGTQGGYVNFARDVGHVQGGAFNIARDVGYVQGGAFNIARDVGYVQGGAFNIARDVGIQGGGYNIARDVKIFQGGAFNIARDIGILQGGAFNIARDVGYFQGGAFNIARDVGYVQGGAFNIARKAGILQLGAFNIAGNAGRQIGVVNIAGYSEKTPVGLLNIVGNGIIDLTAYADASGEIGLSFRTGTPYFYTTIEYGERTDGTNGWPKSHGFGLGTRFGMNGPFAVNLDLVSSFVHTEDNFNKWRDYWNDWRYDGDRHDDSDDYPESDQLFNSHYKVRLGASYIPLPFLAVTAGVSLNGTMECAHTDTWKMDTRFGSVYTRETRRGHRFHAWPGLYAGVTLGKVLAGKRGGSRD